VHGQSWGGNVAAKVVGLYGRRNGPYDGALLTNGVLAGGSRGYDYRVDLRVVHQYTGTTSPGPPNATFDRTYNTRCSYDPGLHPSPYASPVARTPGRTRLAGKRAIGCSWWRLIVRGGSGPTSAGRRAAPSPPP